MDRKCIINPATGRAVKIDGRLGKKLNKKQTEKEDSAVKKLQAVVRRQTTSKPVEKKTIEIEDKKPRKPRGSGGGRKKKEPVSVVKSEGAKATDDISDAIKTLQAVVKRQSTTKKYDKEKAVKTLQSAVRRKVAKKPSAPAPPKSGKKFDVDYIKGYAKFIKSRTTLDGLEKELEKAKNGKEVKNIYNDYMGSYYKSQQALIKIVDTELTQSESQSLINIKTNPDTADPDVRLIYYKKFESPFFELQQDYLFKYEEPAE